MSNNEINAKDILQNHGGVNGKDFAQLFNEESDPDEIDLIYHSPYYSPSNMPNSIVYKDNLFGVLSLNSQSILAKFHSLEALIATMKSQGIHFPVICIQETWLSDESKLAMVKLDGYQTFYTKASSSSHGGLITYVDDIYEVSLIKKIDSSSIWDGLFLKLKHSNMQNEIIVGNLYKPPRDNNNTANITAFREELESVLRDLDMKNSEALICGDFNINILKINDETHFCDFFDTMLAYSFYPKITFPTRLNHSSGATLIDNIYCRLSSRSVKTTSGIITDPLSDHFPYFMCLDMVTMNPVKSLKKIKKYVNHQSAMANLLSEMTARDITNDFNKELTSDPNHNYDILHNHIKELKDKHLPIRYEKFHKHRHKKNK